MTSRKYVLTGRKQKRILRGCNMEVPFITRLAPFTRNTNEFGMTHKKINAFHPCVFLRLRCFIEFAITGGEEPSITFLICTCSSFAMMMRWNKLKFGRGYIGTGDRVNRV